MKYWFTTQDKEVPRNIGDDWFLFVGEGQQHISYQKCHLPSDGDHVAIYEKGTGTVVLAKVTALEEPWKDLDKNGSPKLGEPYEDTRRHKLAKIKIIANMNNEKDKCILWAETAKALGKTTATDKSLQGFLASFNNKVKPTEYFENLASYFSDYPQDTSDTKVDGDRYQELLQKAQSMDSPSGSVPPEY